MWRCERRKKGVGEMTDIDFYQTVIDLCSEGLSRAVDYRNRQKRNACMHKDLNRVMEEATNRLSTSQFQSNQLVDLIKQDQREAMIRKFPFLIPQ